MDEAKTSWDSRVTWGFLGYRGGGRTYACSDECGKTNTDKIMTSVNKDSLPAFVWCRAKGADWYLPAKNELLKIFSCIDAVNATLSSGGGTRFRAEGYWSSTESWDYKPQFCAWLVFMGNGDTLNLNKDYNLYVRAVSTF